ncbi:cytochrome P450 [Striga asiatica]|uniref:Cytochrome P450 n=1 Tax=Striga asiatica TaxID=4170 RepID=A0A5A7QUI6_STRAF|nr:cytochrome P450 [Striga asiatica]
MEAQISEKEEDGEEEVTRTELIPIHEFLKHVDVPSLRAVRDAYPEGRLITSHADVFTAFAILEEDEGDELSDAIMAIEHASELTTTDVLLWTREEALSLLDQIRVKLNPDEVLQKVWDQIAVENAHLRARPLRNEEPATGRDNAEVDAKSDEVSAGKKEAVGKDAEQ